MPIFYVDIQSEKLNQNLSMNRNKQRIRIDISGTLLDFVPISAQRIISERSEPVKVANFKLKTWPKSLFKVGNFSYHFAVPPTDVGSTVMVLDAHPALKVPLL